MKNRIFLLSILIAACTTQEQSETSTPSLTESPIERTTEEKYQQIFSKHTDYISDGFDYPVGKPDAKKYYNAQAFTKNGHLGDDWNAITGGNTDLGHPIYVAANGYVSSADDIGGGWGKIIRVIHALKDTSFIETVYAHCEEILVEKGQFIKRGDKIGTIGNVDGLYYAHLHFELRDSVDMNIGGGYSETTTGYLDPTDFIKKHRPER